MNFVYVLAYVTNVEAVAFVQVSTKTITYELQTPVIDINTVQNRSFLSREVIVINTLHKYSSYIHFHRCKRLKAERGVRLSKNTVFSTNFA